MFPGHPHALGTPTRPSVEADAGLACGLVSVWTDPMKR